MPIPSIRFTKSLTTEMRVGDTVACDLRARIAVGIAERLALVAGEIDGEDSAGRQKLRLMGAEEVAERSVQIADALVRRLDSRGWLHEVPLPERECGDCHGSGRIREMGTHTYKDCTHCDGSGALPAVAPAEGGA